jgi:hypothetical protein
MGEAIVRDLQEGLPVRVRGMNDPEEAERELEHRRIRMIVRMPPDFSAKAASTSIKKPDFSAKAASTSIKKPAPRTSAAGAAQPKMN